MGSHSELPKPLQASSNIFLISLHFHVSGIPETWKSCRQDVRNDLNGAIAVERFERAAVAVMDVFVLCVRLRMKAAAGLCGHV